MKGAMFYRGVNTDDGCKDKEGEDDNESTAIDFLNIFFVEHNWRVEEERIENDGQLAALGQPIKSVNEDNDGGGKTKSKKDGIRYTEQKNQAE